MKHTELLALLDGVKQAGKDQWASRCPAHEDKTQSLCIGTGRGDRILLHCQAGCKTDAVLGHLGVEQKDLMPEEDSRPQRIVATYDYVDADGQLLYQVVRLDPKSFRQRRPDGNGGWSWSVKGVRRVLYRLPEVASTSKGVVLVEGEKDADRLAQAGLCATTIAGGAGKPIPREILLPLRGRMVAIIPDNDDPGRQWSEDIQARLATIADVSAVIELDGLRPKGDVSDWLDNGGTVGTLRALIRDAIKSAGPEAAADAIVRVLKPFSCGDRVLILDRAEGRLSPSRNPGRSAT